ncbi:MAG: Npun_R1517 family heterocyst differentiation transcriptional regulator [Cyanobacteria bacterium P01_H01_bin.58]
MTYSSLNANRASQHPPQPIGVYECEVKLKFRLLEENLADCEPEQLLQILVDAFAYGSDEYLETMEANAEVQTVAEIDASPEMRRQLIRLRNASLMR